MNRRQLVQSILALPICATVGIPKAEVNSPLDLRKEVLLTRVLHWDELPFTGITPYLDGRKWKVLEERAHTREGRESVVGAFEHVSRNRLTSLNGEGPYHHSDLLRWHLEDVRYYSAFRRYLNKLCYPLPNLRLEAETVSQLKADGLIAGEFLSSSHTFEMTWAAARDLGIEAVCEAIVPNYSRKEAA